jgi:hypothetical protein
MEDLNLNAGGTPDQGNPANPADGGQQPNPANPTGWSPDGWTPPIWDQWGTPAPDQGPGQPQWDQWGKPADKNYNDVIANLWQDTINSMMEQYDQVVEILKDPEQLKNLSKDQVMQLYNARDQLQDRLSQIIPVLEQSKNTKLEEVVKDIENPEVKNYIMQFKDEFDDPEEFSALVEFAKWLLQIGGSAKPWQAPNPDGWDPDVMKQAMWGNQNPEPDFDVGKALLSTDPAEREKARKFMNGMFDGVEKR